MDLDTLKTGANIAVAVGLIISALGTYAAYHFGAKSDAAKDSHQAEQERRLQTQITTLLAGNEDLKHRLEPFDTLLKQRYPEATEAEALDRLQRELSSLGKRTETLEKGTRDRVLQLESQEAIVKALAPFPGTKVEFYVMAADIEGRRYAEKLKSCFEAAKWVVSGFILVFDKEYPSGVHLVVREDTGSSQQRALEVALKATGQQVTGAINKLLPAGAFRVVIGPK